MYIESKASGLGGPARIGRVSFSKTGRTLYYDGRAFQSLKGRGYKSNYIDIGSGEEYWISGPLHRGSALAGKLLIESDFYCQQVGGRLWWRRGPPVMKWSTAG